MKELGTFAQARLKVKVDIDSVLARIRAIAAKESDTIERGIAVLNELRSEVYEDLNQIQHEQMIVCAAEWLIAEGHATANTRWTWNPRQTGDSAQPDLKGCDNQGLTLLSGEVTTSMTAGGKIDTRMRDTLIKLAAMPGQRFYFVRTDKMRQRAHTKIKNLGLAAIAVVRLDDSCFGLLADH